MNANDQLREHNSTDNYYKYGFGLIITDGATALADKFHCYWFLDIIASYQPELRGEEFQVWTLTKHPGGNATVKCTDGNDLVIKSQEIPWTDFEPDIATIWVELGTAIFPSEH